MVGCGFAILNFFFCGIRTSVALAAIRRNPAIRDEEYDIERSSFSLSRVPTPTKLRHHRASSEGKSITSITQPTVTQHALPAVIATADHEPLANPLVVGESTEDNTV